ncbi:hypothetical protein [Frankia sp. QA3]
MARPVLVEIAAELAGRLRMVTVDVAPRRPPPNTSCRCRP